MTKKILPSPFSTEFRNEVQQGGFNFNDPAYSSFEDLLSTQEQRDAAKKTKIEDIPLSEIDPFFAHTFQVRDDDDMRNLTESIRERGVITPAIVRRKDNGRYELISGHRRKAASEKAGLDTLRCEVVNMSDDEATIAMVDANLQREHILPSEKAFAYKMKLDAIKNQGQRTDLTSSQVGTKLFRSDERVASDAGESRNQVQRYIRLTCLIPEIVQMVDNSVLKRKAEGGRKQLQMALNPAVEISYLHADLQKELLRQMTLSRTTPSLAQAKELHALSAKGELNADTMMAVLTQEKPNQAEKVNFTVSQLSRFCITPSPSAEDVRQTTLNALQAFQAAALVIERDTEALPLPKMVEKEVTDSVYTYRFIKNVFSANNIECGSRNNIEAMVGKALRFYFDHSPEQQITAPRRTEERGR